MSDETLYYQGGMMFTKGPWEIETAGGRTPAIRKIKSSCGEADRFKATINNQEGFAFRIDFGYGKPEDEANAHLIAAAPELLEEVRGLEESLEEIREWAQSTALKGRHSEVLLVVELMCDNALAAEIKSGISVVANEGPESKGR